MGDIRKRRKQYATPNHPWQKARIDSEAQISDAYALKNKQEIWKANSILRKYRTQAKRLSSLTTEQSAKEEVQLLTKLRSYGIIDHEARLDDVLTLSINDILERRLQTIVYRKGYAKSMKQARQFISHEHIAIEGRKITAPGHLVTLKEQESLEFRPSSSLADLEHPERRTDKQVPLETPVLTEGDEE